MIAFAFLGNTLFLTILVSILSNTFATIASDAGAEIQYRKAVVTLEGVKSDAIFAYQPPFNILAILIFVPLKFLLSPRWFHKIHVATVRLVNLPLLLFIAAMERRVIWFPGLPLPRDASRAMQERLARRSSRWFWERWNIASRQDIRAVFDLSPPEAVEEVIAADDALTHHLIQRQFTRPHKSVSPRGGKPRRRDSTYPGLAPQMRSSVEEADEEVEMGDLDSRLSALEVTTSRIERLLEKLCDHAGGQPRRMVAEDSKDTSKTMVEDE
jgi:hypothetical protein